MPLIKAKAKSRFRSRASLRVGSELPRKALKIGLSTPLKVAPTVYETEVPVRKV